MSSSVQSTELHVISVTYQVQAPIRFGAVNRQLRPMLENLECETAHFLIPQWVRGLPTL